MAVDQIIKVGGLLLAAGGSSRLGRPKQLIDFEGKTLIHRAADVLLNSQCSRIAVVLGAETERSTTVLHGLEINIFFNENWSSGMSSSIAYGLRKFLKIEPDLDAIVITLCDQPKVTSQNIDALIREFHTSRAPIVAARYSGTEGVPALFARPLFNELLALTGDRGAKQIIRFHQHKLRQVEMEAAAFDVDTIDDAAKLTYF